MPRYVHPFKDEPSWYDCGIRALGCVTLGAIIGYPLGIHLTKRILARRVR